MAEVPDIDVETFGPFDTHSFVSALTYQDSKRYPIEEWGGVISELLDTLRPIDRFVLEAKMRHATYKWVCQMVGWKGSERARQIEGRAFRLLRKSDRILPLRALMLDHRLRFFCDWEESGEIQTGSFEWEGRTIAYTHMYRRCVLCGRRDDTADKSEVCTGKAAQK